MINSMMCIYVSLISYSEIVKVIMIIVMVCGLVL